MATDYFVMRHISKSPGQTETTSDENISISFSDDQWSSFSDPLTFTSITIIILSNTHEAHNFNHLICLLYLTN